MANHLVCCVTRDDIVWTCGVEEIRRADPARRHREPGLHAGFYVAQSAFPRLVLEASPSPKGKPQFPVRVVSRALCNFVHDADVIHVPRSIGTVVGTFPVQQFRPLRQPGARSRLSLASRAQDHGQNI